MTLRHFNSVSPSAVGVNTTHPDRQDNADVQKGLGRLIQPYMVGRPVGGQQKNPHQNINPDKVFINTMRLQIKQFHYKKYAKRKRLILVSLQYRWLQTSGELKPDIIQSLQGIKKD